MVKQHYRVTENVPGYLSEAEPYLTTNKREAVLVARARKREILESGYGPCEGPDLRAYGRDGDYDIQSRTSDTFLGVVIRVTPCTDPDCSEELD